VNSVTIKELLDAGVHFGHQTRRWNPKMEDYIFESRNKIHIIDIRKTIGLLNAAMNFIRDVVADGKDVLLVGTKKQSREILRETAERSQMHYVVDRWLGGALTNFQTIRLSINRLEELEAIRKESQLEGRSKKEVASLRREEHKLHRNLDGIRAMDNLPGAMVIVDIGREINAVLEGRKLNIPIVALVDTNRNPALVDFPIPGNDDGIRATKLIISKIEEAINEGLDLRKKRIEDKKAKKSDEKKAGEKKSDEKITVAEKTDDNKAETKKTDGKKSSGTRKKKEKKAGEEKKPESAKEDSTPPPPPVAEPEPTKEAPKEKTEPAADKSAS
jgi:small subunit ribosomal protein S2